MKNCHVISLTIYYYASGQVIYCSIYIDFALKASPEIEGRQAKQSIMFLKCHKYLHAMLGLHLLQSQNT